jgi:hypothetical protein
MVAHVALHVVLGVLALYHLGIGVVSIFSMNATTRVTRALYGIEVSGAENTQLRYAVRMLGLYALALGVLLAFAFFDPAANRNVVIVVIGLQLARALCRLLLRQELTLAFRVTPRRNVLSAALLVAEALVLAVTLPYVR